MQDKARLGRRYTCFNCSCKFYDLNKPEPVCPKCNADQREDPAPDPRVAVMARYKTNRPSAKEMVPDLDEPDEDVDLDEEEDAFEDEEEAPEGEEEDW